MSSDSVGAICMCGPRLVSGRQSVATVAGDDRIHYF